MADATAYPGYATPTFVWHHEGCWEVWAHPYRQPAGRVYDHGPTGWATYTPSGLYVGLFPDKQAAGEALVKHAGYEVL